MGRKKKKQSKPWCWYCNREFEDEKILIQHQKAKHFKCHICNKKLFTGPGLAIHCMQVHKETIDKIPCAVPGRDNVNIEVYGMEGVPIDAELGVADEPMSKQPRLGQMPPSLGLLPPAMPPMAHSFGPPVPFMNPFLAQIPGPMPGPLPSMPPVPQIQINMPTSLPPAPLPGMPPQPAAFPAYQTKSDLLPSATNNKVENKPGPSKFLTAKTRIVCPDENISLEEHKFHVLQRSPQFLAATVSNMPPARGHPSVSGSVGGFFR